MADKESVVNDSTIKGRLDCKGGQTTDNGQAMGVWELNEETRIRSYPPTLSLDHQVISSFISQLVRRTSGEGSGPTHFTNCFASYLCSVKENATLLTLYSGMTMTSVTHNACQSIT